MLLADLETCSVVEAELRFGAAKAPNPMAALTPVEGLLQRLTVLPFDAAAREYGHLRARLERAGTMIGPNDSMIAAIALARGLTLVTPQRGRVRAPPRLADRGLGKSDGART